MKTQNYSFIVDTTKSSLTCRSKWKMNVYYFLQFGQIPNREVYYAHILHVEDGGVENFEACGCGFGGIF